MTNVNASDSLEFTDSDLKTVEGLEREEVRSLIREMVTELDLESQKIAKKQALLRALARNVKAIPAADGQVAH
jgi:hypothetical protein